MAVHEDIRSEGFLDYTIRREADRPEYTPSSSIYLELSRVLREVKTDPAPRRIPAVVLTTSRAEEDMLRSYDLGVNSLVTKPVTLGGLIDALKILRYGLEFVELPDRR